MAYAESRAHKLLTNMTDVLACAILNAFIFSGTALLLHLPPVLRTSITPCTTLAVAPLRAKGMQRFGPAVCLSPFHSLIFVSEREGRLRLDSTVAGLWRSAEGISISCPTRFGPAPAAIHTEWLMNSYLKTKQMNVTL